MKPLRILPTAAIVTLLIITSCEPYESASEIPQITFKSFTQYKVDTMGGLKDAGELVFDFIDGDANIGVQKWDEDTRNLFLLPYQKLNGVYDSIDAEIYGLEYSIWHEDLMEKYTTLKGEIRLEIIFFLTPPFDTMKYDFYMVDQEDNKSNVESTTDIAF